MSGLRFGQVFYANIFVQTFCLDFEVEAWLNSEADLGLNLCKNF